VHQESPTNPRRSFDEIKLHELTQSIRSHGVLVPLIVRSLDIDRFEVVAGARRFRAARLAELPSVPVRVVHLTDTQVLEYQLIENAICVDPDCEVHGKPNHRAEQEAAERERQRDWKRQQEQRHKNRDQNRRLLDAVLDRMPKALTRADYETLAMATIERLQYEDWDAVCERYGINTDEVQEPDAAAFELRKRAQAATEPQLLRMLMELALLPSGWSEEALEPTDLLAVTARRYEVSVTGRAVRKTSRPKVCRKPRRRSRKRRRERPRGDPRPARSPQRREGRPEPPFSPHGGMQ